MKNLNLYILLTLTIFFSCQNKQKEKEVQIAELVNEWRGKQIVFPENSIFTRYLTDTTDFQIPQSDYKVLIYVDSIGCTSCKLQLPKWKRLIEYIDSLTQGKIPFLFFFHPKDNKEIRYLLKRDAFNRPVCIDIDDQLNKLNKFPLDITLQTFLLDKDNKVVVLGNPVHNIAVKDLYLKQIIGKDSQNKNIPKTTAEVIDTEIDFGTFYKSKIKETTIEIKNTGNNPLVIVDVSTTCGCTIATYDERPAKSGESLRVGIKMTPKDTGFFNETVTIKCNTKQSYKIIIKGQVLL